MVERRVVRGESRSPVAKHGLRSASSDPNLSSAPTSPNLDPLSSSSCSLDFSSRSLGSRGSLSDLDDSDGQDSVNVVVRCRPLAERENKNKDENLLSFPGEGQILVNADCARSRLLSDKKLFAYNVVFGMDSTQEDVFEHSGAKRLLNMAVDGFSCTIFCYGQTGSGKTHTLTGPPHLLTSAGPLNELTDQGLIFRCFVYIFEQLQAYTDREFTITASYLEIYNEKVIDLLNATKYEKPLQVRWGKKQRGFFVENLFKIECYEFDDLLAVLEEGLKNRAVASHNMNEFSSRSHTVLTVNISSEQKTEEGVLVTKRGKINFVDLAGSEMTKKTKSEGKTLQEANNINKSLLVLGTCISALSDPKKRGGHIPYRDSNLTKLLADSIAGSGVTLMIACISPATSNLSETLNTLRYATRTKKIRTKPVIIMDPKEKAIMTLKKEVQMLQEENANLKRMLEMGTSPSPTGIQVFTNGVEGTPTKTGPMELVANYKQTQNGVEKSVIKFDENKMNSLNREDLVGMVRKYVMNFDKVKKENSELKMACDDLVQNQEAMEKENERLNFKLETALKSDRRPSMISTFQLKPKPKNKVATPQRQIQLELPNNNKAQIWTNEKTAKIPDSINREMNKRQIGKNVTDTKSPNSSRSNSGNKDEKPVAIMKQTRPKQQQQQSIQQQASYRKKETHEYH